MPDLLEEIKEDIQHEKFAKLWHDTKDYVIGGIIAVIVGTTGSIVYKNYSTSKYEKLGTSLYEAYNTESKADEEKAIKAYEEVSKSGDANIAAISDMRLASILANKGEADKANTLYKQISENQKNPIEIRGLAEIIYLQNELGKSTEKNPELIKQLEKVVASDNPFKHSAKEMLAFALLNYQETEAAGKLFLQLSEDKDTPVGMKQRASEMIEAINPKLESKNG
jgi:hypothetical protein